ncbi:Siroheme synthase [Neofusicoccum parvum]|uniref:Siroheme synthase n=1 Tax=Neofusicoccum parvum TaxID=310453 RepID=A0ACB5RTJ3_9PEZI|nr:Siroheme synthase [Neofusicoccum parvum]
MADPIPKYPLYDATYTAYRLSPLYHGSHPLLDETSLRMHSRRLRDILRGDILRGVDVGAGSTDGSNSGTLEACTWDLIGDEESWERLHQQNADADEQEGPGDLTDAPSLSTAEARGVHIELRYQKAHYTALLLRDPDAEDISAPEGFTALPLLLVRMPAALRNTFTTYLASSFDARIAPMKLRTGFLSATLETLLSHLSATLPSLLTRLQLQLSFPTATTSAPLRTLDITLARADIPEFLRHGAALFTTPAPNVIGPFTAALSRYLSAHLALALAHPGVHVSKIALPPLLALSADGRLKLFSPFAAAAAVTDSAAVSVPALRRVLDAFYASLLAAARAAPVREGVVAGGGGEEAVLVLRKGKGRLKGKGKENGAQRETTAARSRGRKRGLAAGDANVNAAGGARRAEASPKRRRRRVAEEGGGDEGGEDGGEDGDGAVAASTAAAAGRGGRLSVPQEPPPPYELHDPAIVAGGRR